MSKRNKWLLLAGLGLLALGLILLALFQRYPVPKALFGTLLYTAFIGAEFGVTLYSNRVRATILPTSPIADQATEEITIPLQQSRDYLAYRYDWCWLICVVLLVALEAYWLAKNCKFGPCFDNFFWYGQPLLFLIAAIVFLMATATLRQGLRLLRRHPDYIPIFKADAQGLTIPIQSLTGPAFSKAVKANQVEIQLNWSDIVAWDVSNATWLSENNQHNLKLRQGASAAFSLPKLLAAETALLDFASRHLSCPIEVRVPPAKKR
jgi:hypothetical protein